MSLIGSIGSVEPHSIGVVHVGPMMMSSKRSTTAPSSGSVSRIIMCHAQPPSPVVFSWWLISGLVARLGRYRVVSSRHQRTGVVLLMIQPSGQYEDLSVPVC